MIAKTFIIREQSHADRLAQFIAHNWKACAHSGEPLAACVTTHKAKRNSAQNRLYHATLRAIADQAWIGGRKFSKDVWHGYFAGEFLGKTELPGGGLIPLTTTALSVGEFNDYLTQVQQYAVSELGVKLEAS